MDPISNDLQPVVVRPVLLTTSTYIIRITALTCNSLQVVGLSHDSMNAYVVSLVLEALLLGTFTVTYTMGAYSLLKSLAFRTRQMRDWVLLGTSTAMFGLAFVVRLLF